MKATIFIQICVLIALIYIGLWAYSAQQEIWSSRQPSTVTLHVIGEYVDVHHWNEGFDMATKGREITMRTLTTGIALALITGMLTGAALERAGVLINLGPWVPLLLLAGAFCYTGHALWRSRG